MTFVDEFARLWLGRYSNVWTTGIFSMLDNFLLLNFEQNMTSVVLNLLLFSNLVTSIFRLIVSIIRKCAM